MTTGDEILTKADIAVRYSMKKSTVDTLCSRSPESLPPFFKMGDSANSPIRFRLSDCEAWDAQQVAKAQEQAVKRMTHPSLTSLLAGT